MNPVNVKRIIRSAFRIAVEDGSIEDLGLPQSEIDAAERVALAGPDLLVALEGLIDDLDSIGRLNGFFDLDSAKSLVAKLKQK